MSRLILGLDDSCPTNTIYSPIDDFYPNLYGFNWIERGDDGYYASVSRSSGLTVSNIISGDRQTLLEASELPKDPSSYVLNSDQTKVLWASDRVKQYRYSFFANYFVQDIKSGDIVPLFPDQDADILYSTWSPA